MENGAKVSVVIPCFNAEKFIDRSIGSVFDQSWLDMELVVVDDGSGDGSAEHILRWRKAFAESGRRLLYLYQDNKGPAEAVSLGLKHITGKYLTLLDADDVFLEGSVSERARFLEENADFDMVRTNGYIVSGESKLLFVSDEREKTEDIFEMLLLGETNNWSGSYMLRTDALWKVYPDRSIYPSRFGQNLQLMLPLARGGKCGFIDRPLMHYIQTEKSLTRHGGNGIKTELRNAGGFYDIRLHLLETLVKDPEKRNAYLKEVRASFLRRRMLIARRYGDRTLMKASYGELKAGFAAKPDDKFLYWQICRPHFYRALSRAAKAKRKLQKAAERGGEKAQSGPRGGGVQSSG